MAKTKDITRVQDNILNQFKRDARSSNNNSAVAQAIRRGQKDRQKQQQKPKQEEVYFSPLFLTTGK